MLEEGGLFLQDTLLQSSSLSSLTHVNYSCGSCGHELNLNSCNRNTSFIGCQYGKSIKKGTISFFSIDESRFTQVNELRCKPYFTSRRSWGLFRRRTKLLCGKCQNFIGTASKENISHNSFRSYDSSTWDGISGHRMFHIKIRSLQPSSFEKSGTFV